MGVGRFRYRLFVLRSANTLAINFCVKGSSWGIARYDKWNFIRQEFRAANMGRSQFVSMRHILIQVVEYFYPNVPEDPETYGRPAIKVDSILLVPPTDKPWQALSIYRGECLLPCEYLRFSHQPRNT